MNSPTLPIVVDRDIPQALAAFSDFGEVMLVDGRSLTREQLGDAEILLVRSVTRVDSNLLKGTNIRMVGTATSGTDHLDKNYLVREGIAYFDAAGCNARAVAEYVLACCFLHGHLGSRSLGQIQVGIIGFGHVGKMVRSLLAALDIRCVINDPPLADGNRDSGFVDLDEVMASDIVTLHVPYTVSGDFPTRALLGASELAQLKPDALLINAARGGVIDEAALIAWMKGGNSASIAIDCWQSEPTVELALLRQVSLATPHIAGHTLEARTRATAILVERLKKIRRTDSRWCALPADQVQLQVDPAGEKIEVLSGAVLQCCDPRKATIKMRETIGLPQRRRATNFDDLRRQAALRREFSAYRVATDGLQLDTINCLHALGFDTTIHGQTDDQ